MDQELAEGTVASTEEQEVRKEESPRHKVVLSVALLLLAIPVAFGVYNGAQAIINNYFTIPGNSVASISTNAPLFTDANNALSLSFGTGLSLVNNVLTASSTGGTTYTFNAPLTSNSANVVSLNLGTGFSVNATNSLVFSLPPQQSYYFTAKNSNVTGDNVMSVYPVVASITTLTSPSLTCGANTVVATFITNQSGITFLPFGSDILHIHASATSGCTVQLVGKIMLAQPSGATIGNIGTTQLTAPLTSSAAEYRSFYSTENPFFFSPNERILVQVVAVVGSSGTPPQVTIYMGQNADSHLAMSSELLSTINNMTGALQIVGNNGINVVNGGANILITNTASSGGTPALPSNSLQRNNGGSFGGSNIYAQTTPYNSYNVTCPETPANTPCQIWTDGKLLNDYSVLFNSSTASGNIPNTNWFNTQSNSITIEVWFRTIPTQASGSWGIVQKTGIGVGYTLRITSSTLVWQIDPGAGRSISAPLSLVTDGNWHDIVAEYNAISTIQSIYIDGLLRASQTMTGGNLRSSTVNVLLPGPGTITSDMLGTLTISNASIYTANFIPSPYCNIGANTLICIPFSEGHGTAANSLGGAYTAFFSNTTKWALGPSVPIDLDWIALAEFSNYYTQTQINTLISQMVRSSQGGNQAGVYGSPLGGGTIITADWGILNNIGSMQELIVNGYTANNGDAKSITSTVDDDSGSDCGPNYDTVYNSGTSTTGNGNFTYTVYFTTRPQVSGSQNDSIQSTMVSDMTGWHTTGNGNDQNFDNYDQGCPEPEIVISGGGTNAGDVTITDYHIFQLGT